MAKEHHYSIQTTWTGNLGEGTTAYDAYDRSHTIAIAGKQEMHCSSDAAFRGDVSKHNPEDLLLASLSACHMLWYLHLCADAGIVVTAYEDAATGTLTMTPPGGRFTEVTLHPVVTITDPAMHEKAIALHEEAHHHCFIANSMNFPVRCQPSMADMRSASPAGTSIGNVASPNA